MAMKAHAGFNLPHYKYVPARAERASVDEIGEFTDFVKIDQTRSDLIVQISLNQTDRFSFFVMVPSM